MKNVYSCEVCNQILNSEEEAIKHELECKQLYEKCIEIEKGLNQLFKEAEKNNVHIEFSQYVNFRRAKVMPFGKFRGNIKID